MSLNNDISVISINNLADKIDNDSHGNTSNSDNQNENGKRVKRTRNRPCKSDRFQDKREELIKELENIIGLNENKRNITLYELENNSLLINKLQELIPNIKKYFKCSTWGFFSSDPKKGMGNEIGLLKAIFKNEKYNILNKRKQLEYDGIKKLYTELYFIKNI